MVAIVERLPSQASLSLEKRVEVLEGLTERLFEYVCQKDQELQEAQEKLAIVDRRTRTHHDKVLHLWALQPGQDAFQSLSDFQLQKLAGQLKPWLESE